MLAWLAVATLDGSVTARSNVPGRCAALPVVATADCLDDRCEIRQRHASAVSSGLAALQFLPPGDALSRQRVTNK